MTRRSSRSQRAKRIAVGVICLCIIGNALALPLLAFLVEPAADFVGGLLMQTAARQTIVAIGVAANDASWVVPLTSLASRAATILRIAGALSKYEIPLQPGVSIPANVPQESPSVGVYGSFNNPFNFDDIRLLYNVTGSNFCRAEAWGTKDGVAHFVPSGVYSFSALQAACLTVFNGIIYNNNHPSGMAVWTEGFEAGKISGLGKVEVFVKGFGFERADGNASFVSYSGFPAPGVSVTMKEATDGLKRFVRSSSGLLPDKTDPDWSESELANFTTPSAVKFTDANQNVAVVTATDKVTQIKTAAQTSTDVKYRVAELSPTAVPTSIEESLIKNASASDVVTTSDPLTDGNTGTGTIEFPSDYARQGEAASTPIQTRLDKLHDDLTKTVTPPSDPTAPPSSEFEDGFFKGTFAKLLSWNLPPHTSTCPTATMNLDFFGRPLNLKMDEQCELLNDPQVSSVAAVSFDVSWLIAALFIVLWA